MKACLGLVNVSLKYDGEKSVQYKKGDWSYRFVYSELTRETSAKDSEKH